MTSPAIQAMCDEALQRLVKQINRSAGQHARAIKRAFSVTTPAGNSTPAPTATTATAFQPRPERHLP